MTDTALILQELRAIKALLLEQRQAPRPDIEQKAQEDLRAYRLKIAQADMDKLEKQCAGMFPKMPDDKEL